MISKSQAESTAKKAGLSPDQVNEVVNTYSDAQVQALKEALLVASSFVLVGLWFARRLPNRPLPKDDDKAVQPPAVAPPPEPAPLAPA